MQAPQAGRRSAAYAYGLLAREDVTPEACEAAKDPNSVQAKVVALLKEKVDKDETGVAAGKGFYEYGKK